MVTLRLLPENNRLFHIWHQYSLPLLLLLLQANLGQLDLSIPAAGPPCLEVTEGGAHTYDLPYNECVGPSACPAGLCRFLSATTTRSGWGPDLRRAMVASKGKLLLEMVELLGGKAVPNRVSLA